VPLPVLHLPSPDSCIARHTSLSLNPLFRSLCSATKPVGYLGTKLQRLFLSRLRQFVARSSNNIIWKVFEGESEAGIKDVLNVEWVLALQLGLVTAKPNRGEQR
jgi:hypothetical protein